MGLPEIGFGRSPYRGNGLVVNMSDAVDYALEVGYRLFDSAELYGNERELREKLRGPKAPAREELYAISKVWNTHHAYKDAIPIPSSVRKDHIAANFRLNYFSLSETDLRMLDTLEQTG
jgi:diketogulonate reductase-like aldo/keto reductase